MASSSHSKTCKSSMENLKLEMATAGRQKPVILIRRILVIYVLGAVVHESSFGILDSVFSHCFKNSLFLL